MSSTRPEMPNENTKHPCPSCGGTGQLSTFKGVSRFLLTVEECPECNGLGYLLPSEDTGNPTSPDTPSDTLQSR